MKKIHLWISPEHLIPNWSLMDFFVNRAGKPTGLLPSLANLLHTERCEVGWKIPPPQQDNPSHSTTRKHGKSHGKTDANWITVTVFFELTVFDPAYEQLEITSKSAPFWPTKPRHFKLWLWSYVVPMMIVIPLPRSVRVSLEASLESTVISNDNSRNIKWFLCPCYVRNPLVKSNLLDPPRRLSNFFSWISADFSPSVAGLFNQEIWSGDVFFTKHLWCCPKTYETCEIKNHD